MILFISNLQILPVPETRQVSINKKINASFLTKRFIEIKGIFHGVLPYWFKLPIETKNYLYQKPLYQKVVWQQEIVGTEALFISCVRFFFYPIFFSTKILIETVNGIVNLIKNHPLLVEEEIIDLMKKVDNSEMLHLLKDDSLESIPGDKLAIQKSKLLEFDQLLKIIIKKLKIVRDKAQRAYPFIVKEQLINQFKLFANFYSHVIPILEQNREIIAIKLEDIQQRITKEQEKQQQKEKHYHSLRDMVCGIAGFVWIIERLLS